MKSVLISIQPYYVFLIIARLMEWDIPHNKTVEVRKDFPKAPVWNKITHIYCSKNRKSFNRIPTQYQPFMYKLLGKVIGEFVCDKVECIEKNSIYNAPVLCKKSCLSINEIADYTKGKTFYCWHISELKIYDEPKELRKFGKLKAKWTDKDDCCNCIYHEWIYAKNYIPNGEICHSKLDEPLCNYTPRLTRPPQSWCYVEIKVL